LGGFSCGVQPLITNDRKTSESIVNKLFGDIIGVFIF